MTQPGERGTQVTVCAARGYHRRTGYGNGYVMVMSDYCADCAEPLHHPDRDPAQAPDSGRSEPS